MPRPAVAGAEEYVVLDGHVRHERHFLLDRGDPYGQRVARRLQHQRPVADRDVTTVGLQHAGDDLAECRLPAPFSPITAWIVPASILTLTSSSAQTPPKLFEIATAWSARISDRGEPRRV